jgi:speckle-type POZ protein
MLNEHDTKEARDGVISITDFDHEVVLEMVRFMYCDEIPKLKEMALELLVAGNKYILPGLVRECENYLMVNVSTENFSEILVTADKLNYSDLKNAAINFIIDNHEIIFSTNTWKSLKESNMSLGMEVMERCFQALYKKMNKK